MNTYRERSTKMAIAAKHDISMEGIDVDIMLDFVPHGMQSQRWEDLCTVSGLIHFCYYLFLFILLYLYYSLMEWNTDAWLKRFVSGKSNRNTTNGGGSISRHIVGGISYVEHIIRLVSIHIHINFSNIFFV